MSFWSWFHRKPKPTPIPVPAPPVSSMPVGDLPGWKQIFTEDFKTDAPLGTFATMYPSWGNYPYPWQDTSKQGYYYPEKTLNVSNSALSANLHYDSNLNRLLVAAPCPPLTQPVLYGKFVVRARVSTVAAGYKLAFLLWPVSEKWPDDGEIDMVEGDVSSPMHAYAHHASPLGGQDGFSYGVDQTQWHVYELRWLPNRVEFLVDGVSVGVSTVGVPSKPMRWVLQMESSPPVQQASGARVDVDWVAAYRMV